MKTISRYIMTLVALLALTTQAWAQDAYEQFTTADRNEAKLVFTGEHFKITGTKIDDYGMYVQSDCPVTISALNGETITKVEMTIYYLYSWNTTHTIVSTPDATIDGAYSTGQTFTITPTGGNASEVTLSSNVDHDNAQLQVIEWKVYYTEPITVEPVAEPDANTKQWTFNQPGSDVVLTPLYAPTAAWATMGTEPEVKTLLPAAAEGVIAGTDAPLIAEGTGIVAFAGTSTEVKQGTVMYAVTPASVTDATELTSSDWKNTVPTAKNIADNGATVKVWYYIQGADAPDGEDATLDNTFNNSDVCTTPLTVTVLSNKFDLALNPANANTIDATQASKGTVSVKVGTAAAVDKTEDITDGKLTAIKMGSEVKLEAKPGYKFRKVEVKKAAAAPAISFSKQTWDVESAPANFISVSQADAKAAADAEKTQANAPGYVCIYALEGGQYKWIDSHGRTGQDSNIERIANAKAWDEVSECNDAGYYNSIWFTVEPTN